MRILVCCVAGMSSSMFVKSLRNTASELNIDDCKIAAIPVSDVYNYFGKVDVILWTPALPKPSKRALELSKIHHTPILEITGEEYTNQQDVDTIFLSIIRKQRQIEKEEIKMDKLSRTLEKYLLPFANKLGGNTMLVIIRNAMSANVGLLIIGSISILLTNFPHDGVANFLAPANDFFNTIYAFTSGMMGLLTSISIAYYASIEFNTTPATSILTSLGSFLVTQSYIVDGWPTINIDGLGTMGLLTAMVVGIVSVKILQFFDKSNITIKMPDGVPPAISESFASLISGFVIIAIFTFLTTVLHFDINNIISTVLSPLANVLNTMPGYVVYHMLCGLVFFCGINSAVVIGIVEAFIIQNGAANEAAHKAGETVKNVAVYSVDSMIWAGGTGATIGLVILMVLVGKSKMMRTLGGISLAPAIFNINEPVIFGIPIAFNPLFLIPFVITPGLIAGLTYIVMKAGIVAMPIVGYVPWTIPPIAIGWLMSGGQLSTTLWSGIVVLISMVCYYPFFKIADKQMHQKEMEESVVQTHE